MRALREVIKMDGTPDNAITNWKGQIAPLAECAKFAEQMLAQIEAPLGALYNQAEAAGDQAALQNIMAVWEVSQKLAAQIPPFVAALEGGVATIDELKQQRDRIAGELNNLVKAIDEVDTDHPQLADLVEIIAEDVWEASEEQIYDAARMVMYDEVYDSFYAEIVETFGISYQAAISLVAALRGDEDELDDHRRQLIEQLLKSFEEES